MKDFLQPESYVLVSSTPNYIISIPEVMEHLKLDNVHAQKDTYIQSLIKTATQLAENIMRRELLVKTFRCYLKEFATEIYLKKNKINAITLFQYRGGDSDSYLDVDSSLYYLTDTDAYESILLKPYRYYPDTYLPYRDFLKIEFTTTPYTAILDDVKLALLNHIAVLYERRGDWDFTTNNFYQMVKSIPETSQLIYESHRIINR